MTWNDCNATMAAFQLFNSRGMPCYIIYSKCMYNVATVNVECCTYLCKYIASFFSIYVRVTVVHSLVVKHIDVIIY